MQNYILKDAAGISVGGAVNHETTNWTVQATVKGTGAVSASVDIEVSNDGTDWLILSTITLTGTNSASDGFAVGAPWQQVRARVTAISGTGAKVNVYTCK